LILDDFSENDAFYKDFTNKSMQGRFGNLMMINNDENFVLEIPQFEIRRFYITNTANTRTFDFEISKNNQKEKLKIVGGDIGRVEKEYSAEGFIIAPAERVIFELSFDNEGEYLIKSRNRVLGKIIVKKNNIKTTPNKHLINFRDNSADYKIIRDNFDKFLKQKADKKLRLTIGMKGQGEKRRGMMHRNGMGRMMGGSIEDLVEEENKMGGNVSYQDLANNSEGIVWEENMQMMNKMSNSRMME
jgi:FtsP/CotA-like multicopper oxidase with cupredoxin domain